MITLFCFSKLKNDLYQSFNSFIKEFVREPNDGVSLLLDLLKVSKPDSFIYLVKIDHGKKQGSGVLPYFKSSFFLFLAPAVGSNSEGQSLTFTELEITYQKLLQNYEEPRYFVFFA